MEEDARSVLIEKRGYREDISGDNLTLYISNNPLAARWLAHRIGDINKVALELCCGVGVTLESLAPMFRQVIGVDIEGAVLDACRKNLGESNALDKAELILGDVQNIDLLKSLKADVVVYDIPYWYPEKYPKYSTETKPRENPDLVQLVCNVQEYISKDIVVFAPRETGYDYFKKMIGECECVEVMIDGKHDRNYVFLGNLMKEAGSHRITLETGIRELI